MDILLESLLNSWDALYELQEKTLEHMPEYTQAYREFHSFDDRIRSALGADHIRYDTAFSDYLAISGRAALLTGAHAALRLLTSLL